MINKTKKFDSTDTHDAAKIHGAAVKNAKTMTVPTNV